MTGLVCKDFKRSYNKDYEHVQRFKGKQKHNVRKDDAKKKKK